MSYQFNTLVSRDEANALKDMIFNRAREHAENYSDNTRNDVMEIARNSFVSNNNPFSTIAEPPVKKETVVEKAEDTSVNAAQEKLAEVGFSFPKKQVLSNTKITNDTLVKATVENTMIEARAELAKKDTFMGALNFLNSQAAVSLIRTRADKFEILV